MNTFRSRPFLSTLSWLPTSCSLTVRSSFEALSFPFSSCVAYMNLNWTQPQTKQHHPRNITCHLSDRYISARRSVRYLDRTAMRNQSLAPHH